MTTHPSPQAAARVLPFAPRPRVGRSSWPFSIESIASNAPTARPVNLQTHAARVIATTVKHWQLRPEAV
ncbi:hypothetical protein FHW64_000978 [Variovorax sp. Sphag1AA]|nr:hypothetical protein [Variovorax sp. Sphag1AA]